MYVPILEYPNIDITVSIRSSLSDPYQTHLRLLIIKVMAGIQMNMFKIFGCKFSVGGWFLNNELQLTVFEGIGIDSNYFV